ncbi:MAG: hypothetical protein AUJ56_10900 [Zetaproteobacteria bacterium CG1_02_49_23]|nr:MAG: hypothetical protein AUJ56_10900 [Zetaproteobacteria bacterium CG1_02_49_23]
MNRFLFACVSMLLMSTFFGCATMSKTDCENADWRAIGYNEGGRGIHYSNVARHSESCGKYQITPNESAYRQGWEEGIRRYCSSDTGYRIGVSGNPFPNICPADVEANFLAGWHQGVRRYCTPDNALQQGLHGSTYQGVCPADSADAFQDYYQLGSDVRRSRAAHEYAEKQLAKVEQALAVEKDEQQRHQLLHDLERLKYDEERSEANLIGLEACMDTDSYDTGFSDALAGKPGRALEIAGLCRNYNIQTDTFGYREGWTHGIERFCSYESGLYVGQHNQPYQGVCSGYGHEQFWRGYEQGRHAFKSDRYEAHSRPEARPRSETRPRTEARPRYEEHPRYEERPKQERHH